MFYAKKIDTQVVLIYLHFPAILSQFTSKVCAIAEKSLGV